MRWHLSNPLILTVVVLASLSSLLFLFHGSPRPSISWWPKSGVSPVSGPSNNTEEKPVADVSKPPTERTLARLHFTPLPLGSVKPTDDSWLYHELHSSATGLAGHLYDFYRFVRGSTWLGGNSSTGEYSGLNEGFPYWFNGLVALAYTLPDDDRETDRLRSQVHEAATYVLDAQAEDGWLGPETLQSKRRMLWGRFPFLLGLTALVEANSTGWEERAVPAIWKFVQLMHSMLKDGGKGLVYQGPDDPIFPGEYFWGRVRVAEAMLTLQWLLERYSDKEFASKQAWECMEMLYEKSLKWEAWYNEVSYIKDDLYRLPLKETTKDFPYQHGVNVAQGLKASAVIHRFTHNSSLLQTAMKGVDWTFRYHGAASGTVLADERINGLSPYSGSELCTAVEAIFSLSYLYQALGFNDLADRAELAAFNALPTMLTADHWAHQYVAQPNQPWARRLGVSPFFNTNSLSQTFGLEPHYPCCTVNHPQGWPKFVANSWVKTSETGYAHVFLSPGTLDVSDVRIECNTDYPFHNTLEYDIRNGRDITFSVRVPFWADRASSSIRVSNDLQRRQTTEVVYADEEIHPNDVTGLHQISLPAGNHKVVCIFEATLRIDPRANDTIAVYQGALLYALEIHSESSSTRPKDFRTHREYPGSYAPPQVRDWAMTNTTPWNIAIDPTTLKANRRSGQKLADSVFGSGGPPNYMLVQGCQIDWPLFKNVTPGVPPPPHDRVCLDKPRQFRLVPYGSAKLHMAELPTINLGLP